MSTDEYIINTNPTVDNTIFDFSNMYKPPIIKIIDIINKPVHFGLVSLLLSATISLFIPFASINPPITSLIVNSIIPLQNIIIIPNTMVVIPSVSCIFDIDSLNL